jgi:hypothetical protein
MNAKKLVGGIKGTCTEPLLPLFKSPIWDGRQRCQEGDADFQLPVSLMPSKNTSSALI